MDQITLLLQKVEGLVSEISGVKAQIVSFDNRLINLDAALRAHMNEEHDGIQKVLAELSKQRETVNRVVDSFPKDKAGRPSFHTHYNHHNDEPESGGDRRKQPRKYFGMEASEIRIFFAVAILLLISGHAESIISLLLKWGGA